MYPYSKSIEDVLPLITISSFTFNQSSLIKNPYSIEKTGNNSDIEFNNKKITCEIGNVGEIIVFKYVKSLDKYKEIDNVAKYVNRGYDISADDQIFEVKTTVQNFNQFEISKNELEKALKYEEKHHLFFIKLTKQSAIGYDIINFYTALNINIDSIINYHENDKVNFYASHVKITLTDKMIQDSEPIDLTCFLSDDWESYWEKLFE